MQTVLVGAVALALLVGPDPVPRDVLVYLDPAPRGQQYVMVDGDVLQLVLGTRLVLDALEAIID